MAKRDTKEIILLGVVPMDLHLSAEEQWPLLQQSSAAVDGFRPEDQLAIHH